MTDKEKLDILVEGLVAMAQRAQENSDYCNNRFNKERKWQDGETLERLATEGHLDGVVASSIRNLLRKAELTYSKPTK